MGLPILDSRSAAGPQDLLRLYCKCQQEYALQLGRPVPLDCGSGVAAEAFGQVWDSNRVFDAAVPVGRSARQAVSEADAAFAEMGLTCWKWTMNPSADAAAVEPLVRHLLDSGYIEQRVDVMHLLRRTAGAAAGRGALQVLGARASHAKWRQIASEESAHWNEPSLADAAVERLDDPHWDALMAIDAGQGVAKIGVLTVGEIGLIEDVFVAESHRRRGVGRMMLDRTLETCARSLHRHVMLGVLPDNTPAKRLYESAGFQKVAEYVDYRRPAAD